MPTVRRINARVGLAPLPGPGARAAETPESMGAGVARAQANLAAAQGDASARQWGAVEKIADRFANAGVNALADIFRREREAADQTAVLKASNELDAWRTDTLDNPDGGFYTLHGEIALPAVDKVMSGFDEKVSQLAAGLTNTEQQAAFSNLVAQRRSQLHERVHVYALGEIDKHRKSEFDAHLKNTANQAIADFQNPKLFAASLQEVVSTLQKTGPSLGLTGEALKHETLAYTTQMHLGAVGNLVAAGQTGVARQWAEQAIAAGQVAGEQQEGLFKLLKTGDDKAEAQRRADEIIRAGGSLAEQREKARAITEGHPELADVRDRVMTYVEHNWEVGRTAARDDEEISLDGAFAAILLDKRHSINAVPVAMQTKLARHMPALMSFSKSFYEGGGEQKDDPQVYQRLMNEALYDRATFARENFANYIGKGLTPGSFRFFIGMRNSLVNQATEDAQRLDAERGKYEAKLRQWETTDQVVKNVLAGAKIKPDSPEAAQFREALGKRVVALQTDPNVHRELTSEEVRKVADEMITNVVLSDGWVWDTTKRAYQVTLQDIPEKDRSEIWTALSKANLPRTDQNTIAMYLRLKRQRGEVR